MQTGQELDLFKRDWRNKSEMWTKGKIISMTGDQTDVSRKRLVVEYHQDVGMGEVKMKADSKFLAPLGTYSSWYDWRDEVKKGD